MRKFTVAMGVMLLAVSLSGCGQERAIATTAMNDGLNELKSGAASSAVKKLEEAAAADLTYADPHYYLGQIYQQKFEQFDDAERHFGKALERDPENPQFHYRYGTVLAQLGRHGDAITEFQSAVEKHEYFPKAWFRMGLSQLALNQYTDGVSSLTQSIKQDARMRIGAEDLGGAAFHTLGDLYLRFGFYDKALQVYENGILNNPDSAQLYRGQGFAQLKLGRSGDAVKSLEAALQKEPGQATAYFNLALAQREQKMYKEALDNLTRFLSKADPQTDTNRIAAAGGLRSEIMAELEK